jgi:hypothetical protein
MQCSVCGAEAEDLSSGDFDGLIVRCKRCGEYEIADGALNDFLRLDYDARVAALAKAKSSVEAKRRPAITEAFL